MIYITPYNKVSEENREILSWASDAAEGNVNKVSELVTTG